MLSFNWKTCIKRTPPLAIGLALLFLMAFTSGCGNKPPAMVDVPCAPPTVLLQSAPAPVLGGRTNGDLAAYAVELQNALRLCDNDKRLLREWLDRRKTD